MEQLTNAVDHLALSHYVSMAGATMWTYDYLLTIHDEVVRIWPTKLTLVKVLYFANRYVAVPYLTLELYYMLGTPDPARSKALYDDLQSSTLFLHLTVHPSSCQFNTVVTLILREVELISATWLMMIRVQALYAQSRWVGKALYAAFVLTHGVTFAFGLQAVVQTYSGLAYFALIKVCLSEVPRFINALYFTQIPFEFLLLGMQLLHYWRLYRVSAAHATTPGPLLVALYTGGVLSFLVTVSVRLWAGLVVLLLDPTYWYMTTTIDLAVTSTFISRIFLHLGKVAETPKTSRARFTGASVDVGGMGGGGGKQTTSAGFSGWRKDERETGGSIAQTIDVGGDEEDKEESEGRREQEEWLEMDSHQRRSPPRVVEP